MVMAYPKLVPAIPVAQQIRTTALGMNSGGLQGRPVYSHKGVGLNQNSGGSNIYGSGRRVTPFVAPLPGAAGRVVTNKPSVNKPAARPNLDWSTLSSYQNAISDIDLEASGQRQDLQRKLKDGEISYGAGVSSGKRDFERGLQESEDALNRQGLLRSGRREVADADALVAFDKYMQDLSNQYGPNHAAAVNEQLASIDRWEAQKRLAAEQAAKDAYSQLYPAAPVTPPKKLAGSGLSASVFRGGFIKVWDPVRKRNVPRSLEKLSAAEIMRALARPINRRVLADGWKLENGRIVKA